MESLHVKEIDLGLSRIYLVADRLDLINTPSDISLSHSGGFARENTTVVTVAGTNGKGSCIAVLQACLLDQGLSVGSYTSPHLHEYNERIVIDGKPVSDSQLCQAFEAIDQAREEISLTYFEFGTLAALWLFKQARVAFILLEVGLGGRLDAVNIVDADIAVITSIDIDHQEWLGNDRETISREKLGITRPERPLVIAEANMTPSLIKASEQMPSYLIERDFSCKASKASLFFNMGDQTCPLPDLTLPLPSVSAALCVLSLINLLPQQSSLTRIFNSLSLPGRFQQFDIEGKAVVFDVAHNMAAIVRLTELLQDRPVSGRNLGIMAVMSDKDYAEMLGTISTEIDQWYVGDLLSVPRALPAKELAQRMDNAKLFASIEEAFASALDDASSDDRVVVFGSFYTVSAIQHYLEIQAERK